jgi:hypothetical protein
VQRHEAILSFADDQTRIVFDPFPSPRDVVALNWFVNLSASPQLPPVSEEGNEAENAQTTSSVKDNIHAFWLLGIAGITEAEVKNIRI